MTTVAMAPPMKPSQVFFGDRRMRGVRPKKKPADRAQEKPVCVHMCVCAPVRACMCVCAQTPFAWKAHAFHHLAMMTCVSWLGVAKAA
jgi:hypothetical protein